MGCGTSRSATSTGKNKSTTSFNNSKVFLKSDINNNMEKNAVKTNITEDTKMKRDLSASSSRTADSGICELPTETVNDGICNQTLTEVEVLKHPSSQVSKEAWFSRTQTDEEKRFESETKTDNGEEPALVDNNTLKQRSVTRGAIAFDISFCPETGNKKKAQLPKLERRKKKTLTKEQLEEKMRKATERRQEHNKKIQEKSQAFNHLYEMMTERKNATAQGKNKCEKENDIVMDNVTSDNSSLTVQEM